VTLTCDPDIQTRPSEGPNINWPQIRSAVPEIFDSQTGKQKINKKINKKVIESANKSSVVADMGDRDHNRHGPNRRGATMPSTTFLLPITVQFYCVAKKCYTQILSCTRPAVLGILTRVYRIYLSIYR